MRVPVHHCPNKNAPPGAPMSKQECASWCTTVQTVMRLPVRTFPEHHSGCGHVCHFLVTEKQRCHEEEVKRRRQGQYLIQNLGGMVIQTLVG
eukprot:365955-Chlamydomonas_euryale.AAC.6